MTPTYTIRLATLADLPAILDLIDSAAKWLQACKDTDQWARPWPDEASRDARVEQGIRDGLTWIVEDSPGMLGIRQRRAMWIRVDVWTTNLALHDYYRDQGFGYLRTVPFPHYWDYPSAALFQKATTEIDGASAARFEMAEEVSSAAGEPWPAP